MISNKFDEIGLQDDEIMIKQYCLNLSILISNTTFETSVSSAKIRFEKKKKDEI